MMTESESRDEPRDPASKPVSVAELLAKNGSVGSPPVTGRRRRRRGGEDELTVAHLTGEIPVVSEEDLDSDPEESGAAGPGHSAEAADTRVAEGTGTEAAATPAAPNPPTPATPAAGEGLTKSVFGPRPGFAQQQPDRFPKSPPQRPGVATGPERSNYPQPLRRPEFSTGGIPVPPAPASGPIPAAVPKPARQRSRDDSSSGPLPVSGAEEMVPDPLIDSSGADVGSRPTAVFGIPVERGFSTYREDYGGEGGGADDAGGARAAWDGPDPGHPADPGFDALDDDHTDIEDDLAEVDRPRERSWVVGGALALLQSLLALALGAGLFIAFDQLWRWNVIIGLALTAVVTVGMVAAVQAVRRTDDVVSTLIAVAVALLVTLGPLALHAN